MYFWEQICGKNDLCLVKYEPVTQNYIRNQLKQENANGIMSNR